jgi:diguanylate cyclase (GGDEF)-like protein
MPMRHLAAEEIALTSTDAAVEADARGLRQLSLLVLAGLVCTMVIVTFLVMTSLRTVDGINQATSDREVAQVTRAVADAPGGMNEITLAAMAQTLDLIDARLTTQAQLRQGESFVTVASGSDRVVAWQPHLVGTNAFYHAAPLRITLCAIFILIVGAIGVRVHVLGRSFAQRRRAATQLAMTDGLTGLGNRLAFDAELNARFATAEADGPGFVLILADLDGFKAINDQFGHGAGDHVLQTVGFYLRESAQPRDMVARIGGDEFAVLCSGAGLDDYLADIRRRMATPLVLDGKQINIAASIGVARSEDFAGTPSRLTQAADVALYRAKRSGPGNAELAVPSPQPARYAA